MTTEEQNLISIFLDKDATIRFLGHILVEKERQRDTAQSLIHHYKNTDKYAARDRARSLFKRLTMQVERLRDVRNIIAEADPRTIEQSMKAVIETCEPK